MTNAAASTGALAPVAPAASAPYDDTPMISVRSVWKVFGHGDPDPAIELAQGGATRAEIQAATGHTVGVRDISFEVGRGETFVVMGLSGSGKSTLVRCMTSLIEPIMMVFLGGVIGGMVVAMYLPIFEMAGNIKAG